MVGIIVKVYAMFGVRVRSELWDSELFPSEKIRSADTGKFEK